VVQTFLLLFLDLNVSHKHIFLYSQDALEDGLQGAHDGGGDARGEAEDVEARLEAARDHDAQHHGHERPVHLGIVQAQASAVVTAACTSVHGATMLQGSDRLGSHGHRWVSGMCTMQESSGSAAAAWEQRRADLAPSASRCGFV